MILRNFRARFGTSIVDWVRELARRLVAVRVVESALVLAAQAFLALFPLVIIAYGVLPAGVAEALLANVRYRYGLNGESLDALQSLFTHRSGVQRSLSGVSVLLVIGSATAFTRRLQSMYERTWDLERLGGRGAWRWFAWILGMIGYLGLVGWITHVIADNGNAAPVATVLGFLFWWWTAYMLLGGRVHARALVPGAVLTTVVQYAATLVSAIVLPRSIRNNEASYGPIGVVFALESWLVVIGGILAVCAAVGTAVARIDTPFGARVRGTADLDGWRRRELVKHDTPRTKS